MNTITAGLQESFGEAFLVGPSLWLGRYYAKGGHSLPPSERRAADRRSARHALAWAMAGSSLNRTEVCVSLSHSEGVGAALVGSRYRSLGVDVVRIGRPTRRHAEAVLTAAEIEVLGGPSETLPECVWAIKEAASKATGDPLVYFPSGVQIVARHSDRILMRTTRGRPRGFSAGWQEIDGFLYAWVVDDERAVT